MTITRKFSLSILMFVLLLCSILVLVSISSLKHLNERQISDNYTEKLRIVLFELQQKYDKLQQTGMAEIYEDVYQKDILQALKNCYYTEDTDQTYLYVLNRDRKLILHPDITPKSPGYIKAKESDITSHIVSHENGQFQYTWKGVHKWCIFKKFSQWDWYVVFTVDESVRQQILKQFFIKFCLIVLVAVAAITALVFFMAKKMIFSPLNMIQQAFSNVGRGQKMQIPDKYLKKKNEISVFVDHFLKMDEKIQTTTGNLNSTLNATADGILAVDEHGSVLFYNNRFAELWSISADTLESGELLGARQEDAVGLSLGEIIKNQKLVAAVENLLKQKVSPPPFDIIITVPGGSPLVAQAKISPIEPISSGMVGAVILLRDVTSERAVDKMKTEFVSTAAHELRTPLTTIQGYSELLYTRENIDEKERKKYLRYINEQSQYLANIISDLLDLSRIESGKSLELNMERFDSGDAINQLRPYFSSLTSMHTFEITLPENPPEIIADKIKMIQVLLNLISNAIKYSPGGGVIRLTGKIDDDHFHVSVEDEGIGMAPKAVERIFDKFYRVDASNSALEGTGLGMAIVKHIIDAHGGEIIVNSKFGEGTSVHFKIPIN